MEYKSVGFSRLDAQLKYFKFDHLPVHLQKVSEPFHSMAVVLMERCNKFDADFDQTLLALQDLLKAKDAAVRALIK